MQASALRSCWLLFWAALAQCTALHLQSFTLQNKMCKLLKNVQQRLKRALLLR